VALRDPERRRRLPPRHHQGVTHARLPLWLCAAFRAALRCSSSCQIMPGQSVVLWSTERPLGRHGKATGPWG
jgi:hypothetical protein